MAKLTEYIKSKEWMRVPLIRILVLLQRIRVSMGNGGEQDIISDKPVIYVLLGTDYPNLGDHAMTYTQMQQIRAAYPTHQLVEISVDETLKFIHAKRKKIKQNDVIALKGGGNIGTEYFREELYRRLIIRTFPHTRIVAFPQTVYFEKTIISKIEKKISIKVFRQHQDLHLFLRDKESFENMRSLVPKRTYLVPDIVLSMKTEELLNLEQIARSGEALVCIRDDRESILNQRKIEEILAEIRTIYPKIRMTDTVKPYPITRENRDEELRKVLKEFRSASIIITDRLHGMIFAALAGTPCIVIGTYNHKVYGQYEWLDYLGYLHMLDRSSNFTRLLLETKSMEVLTPYNPEHYQAEFITLLDTLDAGRKEVS